MSFLEPRKSTIGLGIKIEDAPALSPSAPVGVSNVISEDDEEDEGPVRVSWFSFFGGKFLFFGRKVFFHLFGGNVFILLSFGGKVFIFWQEGFYFLVGKFLFFIFWWVSC